MRTCLAAIAPLLLFCSTPAPADGAVAPRAETLFGVGPIPITNSIVTSWVVSLVIIFSIRLMVRKPTLIPNRAQVVIEGLLGGLRDIFEPIVGKKAFPAAFPILVSFFIYIVIQNWSGLLPGVGSIGRYDDAGHFVPFIRPANADWNGTIALAIVAMGAWVFIILRYAGVKVILFDLFGNKADRNEVPGAVYFFLGVVFLIVGLVEVVSILIRPFTLSVRLFGNVYGGENLLHSTGFIFPFYFLELLVGLVQALVFTLLLSVYIGLICNHGDDHDHEPGVAEIPEGAATH